MRKAIALAIQTSILAVSLLLPIDVSAAPPAAPRPSSPSPSAPSGQGALDLGSTYQTQQNTSQSIVNIRTGGSVDGTGVVTGGASMSVAPGANLTAAQFLAVNQILATGSQRLMVTPTGVAGGGWATLTPNAVGNLSSLNVPTNVSLVTLGFGQSNPLNVTGSATIGGSLYALQTQANLASVLNFDSLTIQAGGLLTGAMPTAFSVPGAYASSRLDINVAHDFINNSVLSAPAALNLNVGGNLINQSVNGSIANITAQNLNVFSGLGMIVNSGVMHASDVLNIGTTDDKSLTVNNFNGVLSATNGIHFRDLLAATTANTSISGGDILTLGGTIHVNGGQGTVNINSNKIEGNLEINAFAAHVSAATDNLRIGSQCITGDPTYYNTAGDITIDGAINTLGQAVSIIASGNVLTTAGSSVVTEGNQIFIGSGMSLTGGGGGGSTTSGQGAGDTGTFIINGASSAAGGFIDLSNLVALDSRPIVANANGGAITLVALGTSAAITLPAGMTIFSGGTGTGTNGNVTMIANGNISNVNVDTTGGSGTGGNVSITSGVASAGGGISEINGALQGQFSVTSTGTGLINISNLVTPNAASIGVRSDGVKTLTSTNWNFGARQFTFDGTGANNINATAGNAVFGSGTLTNLGSGALNVTATGAINLVTPISLGSQAINSNGIVNLTGSTINMQSAGTLNIRSLGMADGSFISGTKITGSNGILFPGAGTLTINFSGTGGSFYDQVAGVGFSGIANTNLRINSQGDIHFVSNLFDNLGSGSITTSSPANGFWVVDFDTVALGTSRYSNIASNGGALFMYSNGIIDLNNNISNGGAQPGFGGINVGAGYFCGSCTNLQTGIRVQPSARITASNQLIVLSANNVQTSPPANAGQPVIDIMAGSSILSTGTVVNNVLTGAGIEISVNITTSPPLQQFLALRSSLPVTPGYLYPNSGIYQDYPSAPTSTPGFFLGVMPGGTGALLADQGGAIITDTAGLPTLISGAGRAYAHGGVIYIGGRSYAGEIRIDGSLMADASLPLPLPPPPPPPPPPPRPVPVIEPPTGISFGEEFTETSNSLVPTDTTKFAVTAQALGMAKGVNSERSSEITEAKNGSTIVLTACQPFVFGDDPNEESKKDSVAVAAAGTELSRPNDSQDNRSVDLKEGKMVVAAGKGGMSITTSKGINVIIPENSTAIVERTRNGQVVVTSLAGPSAQVTIGEGANGKQMSVDSGTELAVSDDEILIPTDSEDQTLQIEATLVVANKNVQKRKFNIEKRIGRERILVCAQGGSSTELNRRLRDKVQQLRNAHAEEQLNNRSQTKDISSIDSHYAPVVYVTPSAPVKPLGLIKAEETANATVNYLRGPAVDMNATDAIITLKKGEFLVSAKRSTKLLVADQPFNLDAGAIVLVNARDSFVSVSNLFERHVDSVHASIFNHKVALNAGFEIVFGYKGSLLHALQQDSIARRSLTDYSNSQRKAPMASCEFSYASLFSSDPLLGKMARGNRPEHRAIIGKTMKSAAAVSLVTSKRGPYAKVNEYNEYDK